MATQYEMGTVVGDYLDGLGVHPITVAEAVSVDYLERSYQAITENPKITKREFLNKVGIEEVED